ncbi:unnamed protein product [Ambrosiozyma monospora]|uniref:Unnamed protein product n=1 Tax=Ambrosiozyma monospora TaxID=43982 RepID=A0ACB5TCY0_AMBMO|nr:unnamed protein product [Ambrosiozyma monospora]
MEPIMNVSVFLHDADLGVVSQDLMNARNARINAIDDEASAHAGDLVVWAKEQSEKTYIPHDPTLQYMKLNQSVGKKVIRAEAPLKEMIGYLPRLRSLTQGRGVYDMEFQGMQRANRDRLSHILSGA